MTTHDPAYGSGALEMVQHGVAELDRALPGWLGGMAGDVEALACLLGDLRVQRERLHQLESLVESECADAMDRNEETLPDGRVLTRGSPTRRRWDADGHRKLAHDVADACITTETGELCGDPDTAHHVAEVLLSTAGIQYWRGQALYDHTGLSANDYCTRQRVRRTVRISSARTEGA